MLREIAKKLTAFNTGLGIAVSWLNLVMVGVTFLIVFLRYGLGLGWVWMQEIVLYSHAIVFLSGAGFTFAKDAHVRVDVFNRSFSKKTRSLVEALGVLFLLFPFVILIFWESLPFVMDSWKVFEGSKDGGGLEAVFLLKTFALVFCGSLFLQGLAVLLTSISVAFEKGAPSGTL